MRLPERTGDQVRMGVAVTVPEPFGAVLQVARARFGDPMADLIPPHVTLLGPTVVEHDEVAVVDEHLDAVARRHTPFVLRLHGTSTFRPVTPVVFVRLDQGGAQCRSLERDVHTGILDRALQYDYHPHVTVAHEVPDEQLDEAAAGLADFEATFVVSEFHSYAHGDDGVWRPVREFLLRGEPDPSSGHEQSTRAADARAVRPT